MADPHPSPHWEPLALVPLEDLAAQHLRALCLALKIHQLVWLEAYPTQTILTHGTASTVPRQGSLPAPAGLKEQKSGTKGIEGKKARGETFPISRMKRTETICCMADNL